MLLTRKFAAIALQLVPAASSRFLEDGADATAELVSVDGKCSREWDSTNLNHDPTGTRKCFLHYNLPSCSDRPGLFGEVWVDSLARSCEWYSEDPEWPSRCVEYGPYYENHGYTASQACCQCGGGGNMIDLLVVYTDKVGAERDPIDLTRFIADSGMVANLAFKLSGISARVRVVHVVRDNFSSGESCPSFDEDQFTNTQDLEQTIWTRVERCYAGNELQLHSKYSYDIPVLLTSVSSTVDKDWCGVSMQYPESIATNLEEGIYIDMNDKKYCWWSSDPYYSILAHEVGHLLRGQHDIETAKEENLYDKSYDGYAFSQMDADGQCQSRSLMFSGLPGTSLWCPEALRFSNLNYPYNGETFGSSIENNARQLETYAKCKANKRPAKVFCDAPHCSRIGDGICHQELNTEVCGWDGGDCCEESCIGDCTTWTSDTCIDPMAREGVTIVNTLNGKCLDTGGKSLNADPKSPLKLQVVVKDCDVDSDSQRQQQQWYYHRSTRTIRSKFFSGWSPPLCLTGEQGLVYMSSCNGGANQQWGHYESTSAYPTLKGLQITRILPYEDFEKQPFPGSGIAASNLAMCPDQIVRVFSSLFSSVGLNSDKTYGDIVDEEGMKPDIVRSNEEWLIPDHFFGRTNPCAGKSDALWTVQAVSLVGAGILAFGSITFAFFSRNRHIRTRKEGENSTHGVEMGGFQRM